MTLLTLAEACERKYGRADYRTVGRRRVPAGHLKTLYSRPHQQPWFGFALRDGSRLFWPATDVERWCGVFNHNRAEYARELLADERQEVRDGVRARLEILSRGRLSADLEELVEEVLA
ncbi:MAG TPA: hypothetical protein VM223_01120 [Planctomycetota bacterium]|nr:hypothetical protein [Planctomycetota bacterium]